MLFWLVLIRSITWILFLAFDSYVKNVVAHKLLVNKLKRYFPKTDLIFIQKKYLKITYMTKWKEKNCEKFYILGILVERFF